MTDFEELKKNRQDREATKKKQEVEEHSRFLEIRRDLEEMVETDSIDVDIPRKGKKPVVFKFKKLTRKEVNDLLEAQRVMGASGLDRAKAEEEFDKIVNIIVTKSMDGLTAEYLKEGTGFTADVFNMLMISLVSGSSSPTKEYVEGLQTFRR